MNDDDDENDEDDDWWGGWGGSMRRIDEEKDEDDWWMRTTLENGIVITHVWMMIYDDWWGERDTTSLAVWDRERWAIECLNQVNSRYNEQ